MEMGCSASIRPPLCCAGITPQPAITLDREMKPHDPDAVRALSSNVIAIAHAAMDCPIDDRSWQTLIAAGIELRRLANLPPPWEDDCANKPLENSLSEVP
jgi:hypothetical protein